MNTLFVFALLVAGTQAGYLAQPAPAVYAAAPVAVASPVLTATYPAYSVHSPIAQHLDSTYAAPVAPALLAAPVLKTHAAPAFLAAPAPALLKSHHIAAPAVYAGAVGLGLPYGGFVLRK